MTVALILATSPTIGDTAHDNGALIAGITALTATHNAAFPIALASPPPFNVVADATVFATNIGQKQLVASFTVPAEKVRYPNDAGECHYEFDLPRSEFTFNDLFGFIPISSFTDGGRLFYGTPSDWGDLGAPTVFHQNSQVRIRANNPYIELSEQPQRVALPSGRHGIRWTAETLISDVFDVIVPGALVALGGASYLKAPANAAAAAGKTAKAAKQAKETRRILGNIGLELGLITADQLIETDRVAVSRQLDQRFTVLDVHPPTLTIHEPLLTLEASDFGGVALSRVRDDIFASVTAADPCDQRLSLSNDAPVLLPLGETTLTWSLKDSGPTNTAGDVHTISRSQRIEVRDTQAPILVPPPGRVLEVDPNDNDASDGRSAAGIDPDIINLGTPKVVDLADPNPEVLHISPDFFPVNSRTEILWSASDHGYPNINTSTASQLITVKESGTNTAPSVSNRSLSTLTSQPIDITLTGIDRDMLDGQTDPLAISIVDRPQHGEFVAPLFPFFIEDYRTNPAGPYGEAFRLSNNRSNWLYDNVCRNNDDIALDWVYSPRFVNVTDSGTVFMIDTGWHCQASFADARSRLSKWDRDGNYLGQIDYGGTTDAFILDQDGLIYSLRRVGGGSSSTLTLTQIRPEFDTVDDFSGDAWKFDFNSTHDDPVTNSQYSYARVDSREGIVYVNDRRRVFAFDIRADLQDGVDTFRNGMRDQYLGALKDGEQVFGCSSFGSSWTGFAMEVDSQGYLYLADSCAHRVHKFEPSYFDDAGNFVKGDYIGWMGRCDSSTNKACDQDAQVSKGYSCSDATCSVSYATRAGDAPGQFDTPTYLSLDPNDVLYVADYRNSRIQRFAPDGSFGGEAMSTGTGVNRGDNPGFVLGNMGQPKSLSVNSTQFFVVDVDESFVHVFETTPFKDITDHSATLSYVSNFNFHSDSDRFSYQASDGLANSNVGVVTVNVARNQRPPLAVTDTIQATEDTPQDIILRADDPDGILGIDFNGLDTLSYHIVEPPRHGQLSGSGPNRSYTPDRNFFGSDEFRFKVNDGRYDSAEATITLDVQAVEDGPQITQIKVPSEVAVGFPVIMQVEYQDDGAPSHQHTARWNGNVQQAGDFVDPDGDGPQPPQLQGIKIFEPVDLAGTGRALSQHSFNTTGEFEIDYCIAAPGHATECKIESVTVSKRVKLGVEVEAAATEVFDKATRVRLTISNQRPSGVSNFSGLTASNVFVSQDDATHLRISGFNRRTPGCSNSGGRLSCNLGNLEPGAEITIDMQVARKAPVNADTSDILLFNVETSAASAEPVYPAGVSLTLLSDSDGDGIPNSVEIENGLNPASPGDAGSDQDQDGLSNLDEYQLGTGIAIPDSDADGILDGRDSHPLDRNMPAGAISGILPLLLTD